MEARKSRALERAVIEATRRDNLVLATGLLYNRWVRQDDNDIEVLAKWAIMTNSPAVLRYALRKGIDVTAQSAKDFFVLSAALGPVKIIQRLLDYGFAADAANQSGSTGLEHAIIHNRQDVVGLLLNEGADIEAHDSRGMPPLSQAVIHGRVDLVKLFLKEGAKVHPDADTRFDPLFAVINFLPVGSCDALRGLTMEGAKDRENVGLRTLPIVQSLLDYDADPNFKSVSGTTILQLAAGKWLTPIVKELLVRGASVETADLHGRTALHCAAERMQNVEVIHVLLEGGASINSTNDRGQTALHQALARRYTTNAAALVLNGAIANDLRFDRDMAAAMAKSNISDRSEEVLQRAKEWDYKYPRHMYRCVRSKMKSSEQGLYYSLGDEEICLEQACECSRCSKS